MGSIQAALSGSDAKRALVAFDAIASEQAGYRAFIRHVLDQLSQLIGSELTTLSLCDLDRGTRTVVGRPGERISEQDRGAFDQHFHAHPLVQYHGTHPGGPTRRITDCVSQHAFRDSPVFSDYYRRIGIDHVMALPLWIDAANVISIVFNRSRTDFSDAERALADVLRHPLGLLYRTIAAREEASVCQRSLQGIAAGSGWHLLAVGSDGRLSDISEAVAGILKHFFGDAPAGTRGGVPEPLAAWLRRRSRNWGLDRLHPAPYSAVRHGTKLTVHFIADPGRPERGHVLLREDRMGVADRELGSLPLTLRERQILALVASGKTNGDIASLLTISVRTVQKHLEHVFEKLGVESRTAAALRALAAARNFRPPPC